MTLTRIAVQMQDVKVGEMLASHGYMGERRVTRSELVVAGHWLIATKVGDPIMGPPSALIKVVRREEPVHPSIAADTEKIRAVYEDARERETVKILANYDGGLSVPAIAERAHEYAIYETWLHGYGEGQLSS